MLAIPVIDITDAEMLAIQADYDAALQLDSDDLELYMGAQEVSQRIQDNGVLSGSSETSTTDAALQETAPPSKERPLKRKASTYGKEPTTKKGAGKRPLKGAVQKNTAENTCVVKRSAKPLRDITTTVQNAEPAAKGVSRRVRQDKLCTYYTHIQQRTGTAAKCQINPSSSMLNNPTGMSILHQEGGNSKDVLTSPDKVRPVQCKSDVAYLNPLKASTTVAEDMVHPQTPKARRLSRSCLKKKQGVQADPLIKPLKTPSPTHTLEGFPRDQTLKPAIIRHAGLRSSEADNAQPPGTPYKATSGGLKGLIGMVAKLDSPSEATHKDPSSTHRGYLYTAVRHSPDHNHDHSLADRDPDCFDGHLHSPTLMSPIPPPGAYDPTSPATSVSQPSPSAICGDNSTGWDDWSNQGLEDISSEDPFTAAPGCSHWDPLSMNPPVPQLQNGVAANGASGGPGMLQHGVQPATVFIPNPPQYDSVNPKEVLGAHVKDIQLAVRKLKRQVNTATLKLGVCGSVDRSGLEAQRKILQMVDQCKRVIIQTCQTTVADIWSIPS
ncbi:uncharacterized protein LOC144817955 [Lissotriton helveticus]